MKQPKWLLLLYQIPAKSDSERVRIWRGLQKMGAVQVKNSVAAVPNISFFRRVLVETAKDIDAKGGEAFITEGTFLFGLSNESLRQTYAMQLSAEFKSLAQEIREQQKGATGKVSANELMKWDHKKTKFNGRMKELAERSIGSVDGEEQCLNSLRDFENKLKGISLKSIVPKSKTKIPSSGAVWVTRKNLYIDRLASAWLIKRYIDPKAQFHFVDMDKYNYKPEHIRFDVFEGEYGHVGDKCTFEVLVESFKLKNKSINTLAEVIHDLDIDDQKFDRREAVGIRMALEGVVRAYKDDSERLQMAMNLFDSLILSLKG